MTTSAHHATRQRAFRDVVVQMASQVLNLALGVVVTALVVRTLGDAGYGQWSTVMAIVQLVGYFMSFGMQQVAVREAASDPENAGDWVGALVAVRVLLSIPAALVGIGVVALIHTSHSMLIAGIILLVEFPLGVGGVLAVVHQLRMRNSVPMVVLTINSVIWGIWVVVVAITGGGLVALAIGMTFTVTVTALIQAVAAVRLAPFAVNPSRPAVVRLVRTGIPIGISGLLVMAYARIDQVLVFELAGSRDAGLYGSVYVVLDRTHFIPASVMTTLAPVIAASWPEHRDRMLRVVRLAAEFLTIGSLGGLAFATVAARPLVVLIFGADFAPAAPALPVLTGAFVFICYGYLTGNLLLVLGLARRSVVVGLLALVANVAGNLLLIPHYGFMAAAWMTLVTELVVVGTGLWYIVRALGLRHVHVGRIGRIVVAAGVLTAVLEALRALGVPLGGLAAAALVLYPALLLGLRAIALDELRAVIGGRELAA